MSDRLRFHARRPAPARLASLLDGLEIVLQPIADLATGSVAACEALARFRSEPDHAADEVIASAHTQGFGHAVEAACLARALERRADLPAGVTLAVNLSPDVFGHPSLDEVWDDDLTDVVVEVTEHASTAPDVLSAQIERLRAHGALIAVDDVGSGYAGLLRLATMRPDVVKIDRTIVTGVSHDPPRRVVLESLVTLAAKMGATTIAEGIETLDDLVAAADLDVDLGQGWAIGRPGPELGELEPHVAAACRRARREALQKRADTRDGVAPSLSAATLALAGVTGVAELQAALTDTGRGIAAETIGVSILCPDGRLREIAASGEPVDTTAYEPADLPATTRVLRSGDIVEVHLRDTSGDPAERAVMARLGWASLLMAPVRVDDATVGILELARLDHHRWTTDDVVHARGVADHVGRALARLSGEITARDGLLIGTLSPTTAVRPG